MNGEDALPTVHEGLREFTGRFTAVDTFRIDRLPHVYVRDPDACLEACGDRPCTFLCPAGVFDWRGDGAVPPLIVRYEQCVECGACRLFCAGVEFDYPRGGYGLIDRYG